MTGQRPRRNTWSQPTDDPHFVGDAANDLITLERTNQAEAARLLRTLDELETVPTPEELPLSQLAERPLYLGERRRAFEARLYEGFTLLTLDS
jgi:hypothetical protein